MDKAGFKITSEQGFHITFANGVTVSVQFGEGNYCSNRYVPGEGFRECANADVVTWADEYKHIYGGFLNIESGHATPDEVLEIMNRVASLSKDEDFLIKWKDLTASPLASLICGSWSAPTGITTGFGCAS